MDNYKDTAYRMYEDSDILLKNNSWFNCCYLAGYVLECYCKLVLSNALVNGIISGRTIRSYSHNISDMESDISMILLSGNQLSRYCLDLISKCNNILSYWNPNNRYNADGTAWEDEIMAKKFREECDILIEQILQMELDGVI